MRTYLLLLSLCLSLTAQAAKPDAPLLAQAASERVLVERLARNYAWRWLVPTGNDAQPASRNAGSQFERQLLALSNAARQDPDLSENYQLLNQQWQDFQPLLQGQPNADKARQMLEASEEMAWIAQKGSQLLEEKGGNALKPVRLAQDMAALSQRLAKIYLLQSAGLKLPFLAKDLASARSEFAADMRELKAHSPGNASLNAQLQLVETQWLFFQQAIDELARNNTDRQLQQNVYTTSERIYQVASELAQRYQAPAN